MKTIAVLLVTIVAVNAGSKRVVRRQAGWGVPPTTPGWTTTLPPTTLPPITIGWPAPPQTNAPGWGPPPPASAILTNISLDAALAAAGSGWVGENHSDNVQVIGGGGWGSNAELVISSSGSSEVDQYGNLIQATAQDSQFSINLVTVGQFVEGSEGQSLEALGLGISNQQSGSSAANGAGASAAAGDSTLQVLPIASSMGIAKP